ncbi:MAG TPA: acylphosphatase [Cyclobacteriaceae bacterium]|nr:acylphosphatase [Cyclobacteriaceae bacterium]
MKINQRIQIIGKVQGVFFRKSTQEMAHQIGITGWVSNKRDGSVMAEIEGTYEAVRQMEDWMRSGPERAIVEEINIVKGEVKGYEEFEILVDS